MLRPPGAAGPRAPVSRRLFTLLGLFGPNWTSKTEYLYVDLGSTSNLINTATVTTNVTEHIFRTGLNYHFNSPVVAKY